MRTLLMAAVSAIGMGLISAADVSAMPVNALSVQDAAGGKAAVSPVHYYYYGYRHYRYYRPYYRWHYFRHYW